MVINCTYFVCPTIKLYMRICYDKHLRGRKSVEASLIFELIIIIVSDNHMSDNVNYISFQLSISFCPPDKL